MPELLGYQFDRTYTEPIERYRKVSTIAERDAIPTGKRWEGMLCYVTGETKDFQLRGGVTNIDWQEATETGFDTTNDDSDDITEGVVNLFLTTSERAKLAWILITQTVDLDQLESDVSALASAIVIIGDWDASVGTFPGGGTAQTGDFYIVSVAGTVDSVDFVIGEGITATTDNASTSVYASNWVRMPSVSAVTSVVGLTGVITKAGLLSALNVENGATADLTGTEISALITTFLTTADWKTKLTAEEVQDFVGAMIGTQTKISVTYNDSGGVLDYVVDPFMVTFADLTALIAGQGSQSTDIIYELTDASGLTTVSSGRAWLRWNGGTAGTEADYIIVSKAETLSETAPIPLTYADDTALFSGQGNQITNYIYQCEDGSGFSGVSSGKIWVKYLGTTVGDETDYIVVSRAEAGSGNVVGGGTVVDEDIAVYDGTTGELLKKLSGVTSANVIANTTHRSSDGSDHTFLDQSVVSGATPIFGNDNFTEATDKNYVTDAEATVIGNTSGTNTGDQTNPENIIDRLEEDATVTGTKDIDWSLFETFKYVLTGACTFSDTNLPSAGSKAITLYLSGNFAPTYPSGWDTHIDGTYSSPSGEINTIVIEYVKAGTPFYKVSIIQED